MDSIIWVAMITGIRALFAAKTVSFWIRGTSAAGTSTPRSPRATINPSQFLTMSFRFLTASGFSILAMMGILWSAWASTNSLRSFKSWLWRTKDKAIQSTSKEMAKMASSLSFSVMAGSEMAVLGKFTPFLERNGPPWTTSVKTSSLPLVLRTLNMSFPSSSKMCSPCWTSCGNLS